MRISWRHLLREDILLIAILKRCVRGGATARLVFLWRKERFSIRNKLVALAGAIIDSKPTHCARRGKEILPFVVCALILLAGPVVGSRLLRNALQNLRTHTRITKRPLHCTEVNKGKHRLRQWGPYASHLVQAFQALRSLFRSFLIFFGLFDNSILPVHS